MIGYTLCGDKPVSIVCFPKLSKIPPQYAVNILFNYPGYSILWKGWETWERYSDLFPSDNFVLRFIPDTNTLVIINKKTTRNILEDNIDLFQIHSKPSLTSERLLEKICRPTDEDYLIGKKCILWGILLGYGRNNAIAFSNKSYMQKLQNYHPYQASDAFDPYLNPGFMIIKNGTNERENKHIRTLFNKAKENLQIEFKDGNYLEKFIEIFTEK